MRYFASVVVFFCFCINALYGQQNLVLNPSFEDVNEEELRCGFYMSPVEFNNAIQYWNVPSFGTSDIYHMSLNESCLTSPLNPFMASLLPRTGDSMVGIIVSQSTDFLEEEINNYREYVQGQLSSPLIVGNTYKVKFYIYLSNYSSYAVNNIGIKFFSDSFFQDNQHLINLTPDANHMDVVMTRDEWFLIEFEFIPQTVGLTYFVIGNFFSNENTLVEIVEGTVTNPIPELITYSYYFIDDVSIEDISLPIFEQLAPHCKGANFTLPEESENGYTGNWSPAINNQETTTYTFTPDNPDVESITLTVEIIEPYIEPIFDIETTRCKGTIFTLPRISENGIAGTWSPEINNPTTTTTTTTYTFTPEDGSCALETSVTMEVVNRIIPEFDISTIICKGTTITLPSVSENGIAGTWSPEINNPTTTTTTYTFTPEEGSCALETSVTIEIVNRIIPEFDISTIICKGTTITLPSVSENGIAGTWSPEINNQQTTTYTFTPVGHDCAVPVKVTVEVKRIDTPLLNSYCTKNELYVEVLTPDLENQFQWQINGIAIDEFLPTIRLTKYANLLHDNQNIVTVRMTNTSGCVTSSTIEIENKNLCIIPRGISPQGDGLNDTFDLSHFGGVSLQIFNRYGMKIYEKKNYKNEWFGQTNSSNTLLPSGTYFYQIVTHRGEVLTGWVQLVY